MGQRPHWRTVGLLICLLFLVAVGRGESWQPSFAASIGTQATVDVTSPSGATTDVVPEGDDFFTRVLGDPRDMNDRLDLRWQVLVSDISVSDGIWQGTFDDGGSSWSSTGSVFIHYPGFNTGAANIGPIGTQYPIDADTYSQLSFRLHLPPGSTEYYLTSFVGLIADGEKTIGTRDAYAGWNVYTTTLGGDWSGQMQGLRIFPEAAGGEIQFDWIRLTNPVTSPAFEVTWTGPGSGMVDIYCDDDANFSNGTIAQIAVNEPDDGSFTWKTAAFPPGDYYIYIEHNDDDPGEGAYSSGPLTIVPAPILNFTAPGISSGDDYATVELLNPWDMDGWGDILGSGSSGWEWAWHHLKNVSFDGQMHATTTGKDSFIYLTVDTGSQAINTGKYKHLSWQWYVEGDWTDSYDRLSSANGWVTRFHYFSDWPYNIETNMNMLNDVIIWEGWNSYTVDLSQGYLDDHAPGPGAGWTGTIEGLRFDFLEASNAFDIHVDYVLLTADPTAQAGGDYDIEWTLQASDRPMTITLKYDDDQNPDNFVDTIAILAPGTGGGTPPPGPYFIYLPLVVRNYDPEAPTENAYQWTIPSGLSGSYYIYAEVDDGLNVAGWYSEAPLVISP